METQEKKEDRPAPPPRPRGTDEELATRRVRLEDEVARGRARLLRAMQRPASSTPRVSESRFADRFWHQARRTSDLGAMQLEIFAIDHELARRASERSS